MGPIANSVELMRRLAPSLGLAGQPVQKIVIELDVRQAPRVYVRMLATEDATAAIGELFEVVPVADVAVADDCTAVLTRTE